MHKKVDREEEEDEEEEEEKKKRRSAGALAPPRSPEPRSGHSRMKGSSARREAEFNKENLSSVSSPACSNNSSGSGSQASAAPSERNTAAGALVAMQPRRESNLDEDNNESADEE